MEFSSQDSLVLLALIASGAALLALAQVVRVPYPILLVLGGLALGFMPGMPEIELPPDLVLIAFLPPLNIPPNLFWAEMQTIVDLSTINTGLMKASAFGLLIGLAGCWRGLQAERSASGVGRAATAAVVTGILLIIVADALFAVAFDILGW